MVLNAADFLKKGQKKKFIRLRIIDYCLFLKLCFRWKGVADRVCFVKYK